MKSKVTIFIILTAFSISLIQWPGESGGFNYTRSVKKITSEKRVNPGDENLYDLAWGYLARFEQSADTLKDSFAEEEEIFLVHLPGSQIHLFRLDLPPPGCT